MKKKLRAVIYARHSTDKQNPNSSADQTAACLKLVEHESAQLVDTYSDPEISGYEHERPELLRLLRDAAEGHMDIVFCEALDRIARNEEDINRLAKKLRTYGVRLITKSEGIIDYVKRGGAGSVGSMFLSILR